MNRWHIDDNSKLKCHIMANVKVIWDKIDEEIDKWDKVESWTVGLDV